MRAPQVLLRWTGHRISCSLSCSYRFIRISADRSVRTLFGLDTSPEWVAKSAFLA